MVLIRTRKPLVCALSCRPDKHHPLHQSQLQKHPQEHQNHIQDHQNNLYKQPPLGGSLYILF